MSFIRNVRIYQNISNAPLIAFNMDIKNEYLYFYI